VTPRRRAALLLLVSAASLVGLSVLQLPAPDDLTWTALDRWHAEVGPAVASMALVRVAATVAAGWLVLVSAVQLLAAHAQRPGLTALADRVTPRFLRSVVGGAASLSLSVGLVAPTVPSVAAGPPPPTAVMVPLDGPTTTTTATPTTTTSMPTTTTSMPTTTTSAPPITPPSPAIAPSAVAARDERVVRPGDSFWSIAEEVMAGAGDTGAYWRTLIDANRERLVDPGNADLLYPGQVLRLPVP
jgi:hypothetical protein